MYHGIVKRGLILMLSAVLSVSNCAGTVYASQNKGMAVSGNGADEDLTGNGNSGKGTGAVIEENETQVSGNELPEEEDTVSGNTTPETPDDSVSGNQTVSGSSISSNSVSKNSVSENMPFLLWEERLKESRERLAEILKDKVIMALVYLKDHYEVKSMPDKDSNAVTVLQSGHQVHILDVDYDGQAFWYKVSFAVNDAEFTGYIERAYLAYSEEEFLEWEKAYLTEEYFPSSRSASVFSDNADIGQFPESYRSSLYQLREAHPNWTFVKMNTGLDWGSVVKNELNASEDRSRSLVPANSPASWIYGPYNSKWSYASEMILKYFLDPRNFTTDTHIFAFEQLTYNASYHTQQGVQSFLQGSFMKGQIPGESGTYAEAFYKIGNSLGVSPYHLASRVYQEQGSAGTSPMISGTYKGYEGYYNYFNIGAAESANQAEIIKSGLETAKKNGWNTRYKSLEGGAAAISKNYILKGQDTLYLQKFDVESTYNGLYWHQYMQNILAPSSEAVGIRKSYSNAGALENTFVFKIPVYNNMPPEPCGKDEKKVLTLNESDTTMQKGDSLVLTASLNGSALPGNTVTWITSDKSVASVSKSGEVTAVKGGSVLITAEKDGVSASCKIIVKSPLAGIELNKTDLKLLKGKTESLILTILPEDATDLTGIIWSSSNDNIASVSSEGLVTALDYGTAIITVSLNNLRVQCSVTVSPMISKIELEPASLKLYSGSNEKLKVSYERVYFEDDFTIDWSSSDNAVAYVKDGRVYGNKPGKVLITAQVENVKASCEVTVEPCEIRFFDKASNTTDIVKYNYGDRIGKLPEPESRVQYRFIGWFSGEDGTGIRYSEDSVVTESFSAYAYWQEISGDFQVEPIGDQIYTGSAIKPRVRVYDGEALLELNVHYTISYKNNTKVNTSGTGSASPAVTVKGKGNYGGSKTVNFRIRQKSLSDNDIQAADLYLINTGKKSLPVPAVLWNNKKLAVNRDFTVEYPAEETEGAYKAPGTYPVKITGKGSFTGSRLIYSVITNKTLITKPSLAKIPDTVYFEGISSADLKISLKIGSRYLEEGVDYLIEKEVYTGQGSKTVTINGIGDYAGTRTASCKITGLPLKNAVISGIAGKVLDPAQAAEGLGITQDYVITYGKDSDQKNLMEGKDFTLQYQNNRKAGTAAMVFTGIGSYTGTIKKTFRITPAVIDVDNLTLVMPAAGSAGDVPYEKGGSKPKIYAEYMGVELKEGVDYSVSYKNNTAVNDGSNPDKIPTVTVKGKGSYKGSASHSFIIRPGDIKDCTVTVPDVVYKNKVNAYKSKPVLIDGNGRKLSEGTDYEKQYEYRCFIDNTGMDISPDEIPAIGTTVHITVTGKGNYAGSTAEATYRVVQASLTGASVKISSQPYTGRPVYLKKSDITVRIAGNILPEDAYEIVEGSYINNTSKGSAKVTLRGVGDAYGGVKTVSFSILSRLFF